MRCRRVLMIFGLLCLQACSGGPSPAADAALDLLANPEAALSPETSLPRAAPSIDGEFDDWREVAELATDPAGDGTAGFDLRSVKATSRGSVVYLNFEIAQTLNLHAGLQAEGTLLVDITLPAGRLTIDVRGRTAYTDGDPLKKVTWAQIGYVLAPTYASRKFELRIDLSRFGVKIGEKIKIDFGGSDRLAAPAVLTLAAPATQPKPRPPDREAGTIFRIASLNTWHDGLTDPTRGVPMGRLVKAVAADVYCFQEVLNADASSIASVLKKIDPRGDGATWTVQRFADLAIATRSAAKPLPLQSPDQVFTAVALDVAGKRLVVFTVRPPCCGYIGSAEDASRIQGLSQLAATIKLLRQGSLGADFDPWREAAVVLVGDWNLVGSRQPLDVVTDPSGPALSHWLLRHLLVDDVFTWRNDADARGFPPGMLDVLVHSLNLKRRNGYVLDTRDLDSAAVARLGLQVDDSLASDHLMLVGDFEIN